MRTGGDKPWLAQRRSDLLLHVDAVTLALKNWNDTEALRLLRLHWDEIAGAIREKEAAAARELPAVISVPIVPGPVASDAVAHPPPLLGAAGDESGHQQAGASYLSAGRASAPPYPDSGCGLPRNFQLVAKEAKYRS